MKVAIDDQIFSIQSHGGISRYFVELMRAYRTDPSLGVDLVTPTLWTKNRHLIESGLGRQLPSLLGQRGKVIRTFNRWLSSPTDSDIIHHTYFWPGYLDRYKKASFHAITIYDMIPERFPAFFAGSNPHSGKQEYVEAADLIFCISEATRRDVLDIYGTPSAPLVVTPLGVDDTFHPDTPKPPGLPDRYVLYVGLRGMYKDFAVLAEAFAIAGPASDVQLVAVGGGPLASDERALLDQLGIADRFLHVRITDDELPGAYAHAECFVFPSRYEGFGLPTLEAMASGCPTVLTRSSSHIEVGGEAAAFFPPGDVVALSGILDELLSDESKRAALRDAGLSHAARFRWEETARRTAAAYRTYAGSR